MARDTRTNAERKIDSELDKRKVDFSDAIKYFTNTLEGSSSNFGKKSASAVEKFEQAVAKADTFVESQSKVQSTSTARMSAANKAIGKVTKKLDGLQKEYAKSILLHSQYSKELETLRGKMAMTVDPNEKKKLNSEIDSVSHSLNMLEEELDDTVSSIKKNAKGTFGKLKDTGNKAFGIFKTMESFVKKIPIIGGALALAEIAKKSAYYQDQLTLLSAQAGTAAKNMTMAADGYVSLADRVNIAKSMLSKGIVTDEEAFAGLTDKIHVAAGLFDMSDGEFSSRVLNFSDGLYSSNIRMISAVNGNIDSMVAMARQNHLAASAVFDLKEASAEFAKSQASILTPKERQGLTSALTDITGIARVYGSGTQMGALRSLVQELVVEGKQKNFQLVSQLGAGTNASAQLQNMIFQSGVTQKGVDRLINTFFKSNIFKTYSSFRQAAELGDKNAMGNVTALQQLPGFGKFLEPMYNFYKATESRNGGRISAMTAEEIKKLSAISESERKKSLEYQMKNIETKTMTVTATGGVKVIDKTMEAARSLFRNNENNISSNFSPRNAFGMYKSETAPASMYNFNAEEARKKNSEQTMERVDKLSKQLDVLIKHSEKTAEHTKPKVSGPSPISIPNSQ